MNENGNAMYMGDAAKAVLRGKFIPVNAILIFVE